MPRFTPFIAASLLVLAGIGFAAHAQQHPKPTQNGLERLRKEGKVSSKMLREDKQAERTGTVRDDGKMTKKPKFIREEDRLAHRKQPHQQPAPASGPKRHTTLKD